MKVLIIGDGKMGRAIAQLARERGHEVAAVLGAADNPRGGWLTRDRTAGIDVALEFTEPESARDNIAACLQCRIPVVTGTTGWYAALPVMEQEVQRLDGALFWAPNFSLGVALVIEVVRAAGALFATHPHFDAHIVETHHAAKKDAPSGTGAALARAAGDAMGRDVPVTSVRVGHVPGTHTLVLDAPFEQITITHEARDRRVFADGALRAAEWLVGRRGTFTMRDLLTAPEAR
jgi:4-hydroxy-tetrahydrodipicolinate reductase